MAIETKYGRVTLQYGSIGEDEPVVVFRAKDELLPELLTVYAAHCMRAGSSRRHLALIEKTRNNVLSWQDKNGCRIPNSEGSKEWLIGLDLPVEVSEAEQNAQIDRLHGPGAAAVLDEAIKDGSIFNDPDD